MRIVGVSGIYKPELFGRERQSISEIKNHSNKEYIAFNQAEISQAMDYENVDILLLHDWATDIISPAALKLFQQRYSNARHQQIGNEYARLLVEALQPKLVLCGHLHFKYRHSLPFNNKVSSVCCLANVRQGKDSVAVFRVTPELEIIEVTN